MGASHPRDDGPMSDRDVFFLVVYGIILALLLFFGGREVGRVQEQQKQAIACEPKCTFTYRAGKLINVTCPDSTGAMP